MFAPILVPRKPNWKRRLACTVLVLTLVMGFVWIWRITQMPLKSYKGPLHPLSDEESRLVTRLSAHVCVPLGDGRRKVLVSAGLPANGH